MTRRSCRVGGPARKPYTAVGGIGHFQAALQHPNKFVFCSIGQYTILAGKDVPWQESIEFK